MECLRERLSISPMWVFCVHHVCPRISSLDFSSSLSKPPGEKRLYCSQFAEYYVTKVPAAVVGRGLRGIASLFGCVFIFCALLSTVFLSLYFKVQSRPDTSKQWNGKRGERRTELTFYIMQPMFFFPLSPRPPSAKIHQPKCLLPSLSLV